MESSNHLIYFKDLGVVLAKNKHFRSIEEQQSKKNGCMTEHLCPRKRNFSSNHLTLF